MAKRVMHLLLALALVLVLVARMPVSAVTPPEIRLLRSSEPADWEKAVQLILPSDQYAVPGLLVSALTERLFGFFSGSGVSKMLFSDPRRCFWLWDDFDGTPFGGRHELVMIVVVFTFAGVWITLAALVATALLDRDPGLLLSWLS